MYTEVILDFVFLILWQKGDFRAVMDCNIRCNYLTSLPSWGLHVTVWWNKNMIINPTRHQNDHICKNVDQQSYENILAIISKRNYWNKFNIEYSKNQYLLKYNHLIEMLPFSQQPGAQLSISTEWHNWQKYEVLGPVTGYEILKNFFKVTTLAYLP